MITIAAGLEIIADRERFKHEKELGLHIPRADFEIEVASRTAVFDVSLRNAFRQKAADLIALVGGSLGKSSDFLQAVDAIFDELLNQLASMDTFQVLFMDGQE